VATNISEEPVRWKQQVEPKRHQLAEVQSASITDSIV